jgi:TonB family protein
MLANANSQTDSMPLDRNIREVVAICATHDLPHGEPNDLVGFMRALNENKHLAMNFWSLVARLSEKGPHSSQPDWILAIIVEGVTGRSLDQVREVGPAHRVLVSRLASMLAGEDMKEPLPDVSLREPLPAPKEMLPVRKARASDVADITPRQSRTSAALAAVQGSRESVPIAPITNPAWLREERLREERTGDERLRLVLEPEHPSGNQPNPVAEARPRSAGATANEPDIIIPLSSYADASRETGVSGGVLAGGVLLVLLIVFGIWFARNRDSAVIQNFEASVRSGYQSIFAGVKGNKPEPVSHQNSTAALPSSQTSGVATPPAAPLNTVEPTSPAPAHAVHTTRPYQPGTASNPAPIVRRTPSSEALVAAEASSADAGSADANLPESTAGQVAVPAATMQDRLISSRVPIFPEAAKAAGIEGRVIMQAIVNKDGSVGHLHVVSGDPALRRAATDAVSTWRYRPYLVNGEPAEVTTTISVDFFDSN